MLLIRGFYTICVYFCVNQKTRFTQQNLMASVKIILFQSKTLKDGRHPVVLRVTHERRRRYFTLGEGNKSYASSPEQWDEITGRFRKNQPDYKLLNQILMDIEKSASDIILRFDLDKETFTFDRFERTFGRIKP